MIHFAGKDVAHLGASRRRIILAGAILATVMLIGLALNPKLILADEPVSALDVSIQSQILNLLMDLQEDLGLTYLFISHDLAVVRHISSRIAVMYLGIIVEVADSTSLCRDPLHPYTKALLTAVPIPDPKVKKDHIQLKGEIPSPVNIPPGCRFHPRCPYAQDRCRTDDPPLHPATETHVVACHFWDSIS